MAVINRTANWRLPNVGCRSRPWLQQQKAVILGDDLFSHQPFCELVLIYGLDFILVCKPSSHETLYEWVAAIERGASCLKLVVASGTVVTGKSGGIGISMIYRCVRGDDGLRVNWCELTITHELTGERLYQNSFVTSLRLDAPLVQAVTHAGRARWKHENEGHNVLTTHGYHIKHNFGHGQEHLATVMFTLNLLAFSCTPFWSWWIRPTNGFVLL
ncbi:MAG: hypothetical protein IPM39_04110 [Chloroflexi bacterium]|nr:hypothetical protein [Chloroflexota bacterium]